MIEVAPELLAFLKEEYDRCEDQTLEDERVTAIDRYNGEPYGDEEDGRSQVVARDTAETVDYMMISIMRTILSGDDVVEFDHENAELAHQATRTVKWLVMKKQDGYRAIHDWLKAGLLEKNAVAMAYPEPQPSQRRPMEGVSALALVSMQQQGAEIIEAEETGQEGEEGPILNIVVSEPQPPKFCVDAVPNEEFYCSPDARTITDAVLKGRRRLRPVYELEAEGVDPEDLAFAGDTDDNLLSQARDEDRYADVGSRRGSAKMVWWHEEYVTYEGRHLYIRRDDRFNIYSLDEMEDAEDHPFEDWCPFPMQHRRIGQSLADKVMDLERINTVLTRQSLDGIYLTNNPRTFVHEDSIGDNTIEDLLTVRPGGLIRWRGAAKPETHQDRFDAGNGFQMLEYMERKRETRTGITRLNMGLDERTHTDTAKGQDQLLDRGDQVEEYVSRNFAGPLARLFTKLARLLKRYGQPLRVPIDGEYVDVDPRQWPDDMIAEPKLGLGATRKEKRLIARREVIGYQMAAMEGGLPIVDPQKLFNSARGIVADSGLGDVTEFFNDPSQMPPQPEKPDPEMAKVQAQIQLKQQELQLKEREIGAKIALQQAEAQAKLELARQQGATDAQVKTQEAAMKAQMDHLRASFEADLAERRLQIETMLEMQKIASQERTQERAARMRQNRPGGRLDA